jgi:hypothetical protein
MKEKLIMSLAVSSRVVKSDPEVYKITALVLIRLNIGLNKIQ